MSIQVCSRRVQREQTNGSADSEGIFCLLAAYSFIVDCSFRIVSLELRLSGFASDGGWGRQIAIAGVGVVRLPVRGLRSSGLASAGVGVARLPVRG